MHLYDSEYFFIGKRDEYKILDISFIQKCILSLCLLLQKKAGQKSKNVGWISFEETNKVFGLLLVLLSLPGLSS